MNYEVGDGQIEPAYALGKGDHCLQCRLLLSFSTPAGLPQYTVKDERFLSAFAQGVGIAGARLPKDKQKCVLKFSL